MPPSASKAPNGAASAEVRYSAKHSLLTTAMDRNKRDQQRHRHTFHQHQRQSSFSLGCIFDNPAAFEDSSPCRRKIDYCGTNTSEARIDMLEGQTKSLDVWGGFKRVPDLVSNKQQHHQKQQQHWRRMTTHEQQRKIGSGASPGKQAMESEASYHPARKAVIPSCRRKLCLDDPATAVLTGHNVGVNTPLLDNCEVYSDISTLAEDLVDYNLPDARSAKGSACEHGFSTPVPDVLRSPASSPVSDDGTASLRSLNAIDNSIAAGCAGIELEDIGTDASRRESFRSMKGCATAKDGPYFVYPGWSMWSREHSYRSLTQDSPISKNSCAPSIKNFPGVKTLRASLRQHLAAAAAQRHISCGSVNRSSSTRTTRSSRSSEISLRRSRKGFANGSSKCGKFAVVEEAKVPLLKTQRTVRRHFSPRKRWEPLTHFSKGLKSFVSKGIPHDGFSFPSVFPFPGCGIHRFDQSVLLKPRKLTSQKQKSLLERTSCDEPHYYSKSVEATTAASLTGYLQCIFRHGFTSYSFWMDEVDEVLVARPEQGDRRNKSISFYTCKGRDGSGWRHWQKIRKRVVNFIGTMNFSCCIYTEIDLKGDVTHFMDSEFSLFDERQFPPAVAHKHKKSPTTVASYLRALLRTPWEGSECSSEAGFKSRKELAAMVIRVPLKVKKSSSLKHSDKRLESATTWSGIAGSKDESVHVILPAGDHGHPTYGLEGPRPLVERWRSGGLCDCGSWDLGCGMVTLSKDSNTTTTTTTTNNSNRTSLNLVAEGAKRKSATMSLAPCQEEGLYRLSFQRPLAALQAFAAAVAILHNEVSTREMSYCTGYGNETKLPIARRGRSLKSPNPPLSPIDRL